MSITGVQKVNTNSATNWPEAIQAHYQGKGVKGKGSSRERGLKGKGSGDVCCMRQELLRPFMSGALVKFATCNTWPLALRIAFEVFFWHLFMGN